MDVKNFVDASSFFLFEATGDSEVDVFHPETHDVYHSEEEDGDGDGDDDDDDDAESCICDSSEIPMVSKIYEGDHVLQISDEEEEENGEVVEQEGAHGQHSGLRKEQASIVSADSKKIMNEREKSRLFWETCLAS